MPDKNKTSSTRFHPLTAARYHSESGRCPAPRRRCSSKLPSSHPPGLVEPEDSQSRISKRKTNPCLRVSVKRMLGRIFRNDFILRNLEAVEFSVAQDAVVVLVGNVEYSAQSSNTRRLQLKDKRVVKAQWEQLHSALFFLLNLLFKQNEKKIKAHLFVFGVVKRSGGVENRLLSVVEQLRNVLQVLRRTLGRKRWRNDILRQTGQVKPEYTSG